MFRIGKGPEQLTDMAWNNNVSGLQWRVSYRLRHSSQQSTQRPGTRCVPCVQFSTYETSRYTAVYSEHIGYLHFNFRLSWATTTHCTHGALKPSPMTGFKIFTGFHYVRVEEQPRIRKIHQSKSVLPEMCCLYIWCRALAAAAIILNNSAVLITLQLQSRIRSSLFNMSDPAI